MVFDRFTAILYDIILFSTVTERANSIIDEVCVSNTTRFECFDYSTFLTQFLFPQGVTGTFVTPPLEPQFIAKDEPLETTLQRYWQSPAELTFSRYDTLVKGDGSIITQVCNAFVSCAFSRSSVT